MAFNSNMLFDVLENILKTKSIDKYKLHVSSDSFKDASPFMIRKYLSMHSNPSVRQIVLDNYFQLEKMPEKIQYRWLIANIPKQNTTFIKYLR